jgi:addiction module RelE/StbE family toxin
MVALRWTPQAVEDLGSITEFISQDSSQYAALFVIDVFKSVNLLKTFPKLGRIVPELNIQSIREIILGNYRIVYRIKKSLVEILTIYHGSKILDPDRLI